MATKPKKKGPSILWVEILEAKPNKMFNEQQRQSVRFLRYSRAIPCAACGKKLRTHWTMVCQFKAVNFGKFVTLDYPQSFAPLTPVCGDHPIRPDWSLPQRKTSVKQRNSYGKRD